MLQGLALGGEYVRGVRGRRSRATRDPLAERPFVLRLLWLRAESTASICAVSARVSASDVSLPCAALRTTRTPSPTARMPAKKRSALRSAVVGTPAT